MERQGREADVVGVSEPLVAPGGGEAPAVGGLWVGLDRKRRQVPLGLLLRHAVRYRQLGEVLAHFVEDLLGRDDDEARFVEDALGGLASGRREEDVSVRGDAS